MSSWRIAPFDDLSPREVHDIYQARVAVFVMEQTCLFQDVDGADPACWHLFTRSEGGAILAYCRIVPPGIKFTEPSIGRVLTTDAARGTGLGKALMVEAVARTNALFPAQGIRIGAQARLEKFYNELGFVKASAEYDEDGIPHIEMVHK